MYSYPMSLFFLGLVQLELRFDVLVPDFQARLVTAAYKIGPGDLRPQPPLKGIVARAAGRQQLRQLLRVDSHAGRDIGVRIVHFRIGHFEAETLGLVHFQNLVDEAIEHFLARWHLFGAHLNELGAMLDIERRDRLAVDERNDLLRAGD